MLSLSIILLLATEVEDKTPETPLFSCWKVAASGGDKLALEGYCCCDAKKNTEDKATMTRLKRPSINIFPRCRATLDASDKEDFVLPRRVPADLTTAMEESVPA